MAEHALQRYGQKGERPFAACDDTCADSFRCDRYYGLIYGPYVKSDGSFYRNAEEYSLDEPRTCAYCGKVEETKEKC